MTDDLETGATEGVVWQRALQVIAQVVQALNAQGVVQGSLLLRPGARQQWAAGSSEYVRPIDVDAVGDIIALEPLSPVATFNVLVQGMAGTLAIARPPVDLGSPRGEDIGERWLARSSYTREEVFDSLLRRLRARGLLVHEPGPLEALPPATPVTVADVLGNLVEVLGGIGPLSGQELVLQPGEEPGELEVLIPVGDGAGLVRVARFTAPQLFERDPTALTRDSGKRVVVCHVVRRWVQRTGQDVDSLGKLIGAHAFRSADVACYAACKALEDLEQGAVGTRSAIPGQGLARAARMRDRLLGWGTSTRQEWYRVVVPRYADPFEAILDPGLARSDPA